MKIIAINDHEKHSCDNHPERPERVEWIIERTGVDDWWEKEREELVYRAHDPGYIDSVKSIREPVFLDPDTYANGWTYRIAVRAFTASYELPEGVFILTRPPGHHAEPARAMGFCIFNNAVAAALSFLEMGERVGVLDVDAHHGNGTEIFAERFGFYYASVHMGAGYPGTGLHDTEHAHNVALFEPVDDILWLTSVNNALRFLLSKKVDVLVLSLGFDGLVEDPLTYFRLTPNAFYELGRMLRDYSVKAVLEGGYSKKIGKAAERFILGYSR